MAASPLLQVDHLSAEYTARTGTVRAVEDVTFSLFSGEVLGVVGESGSGKSTLALALAGLLDRPGRVVEGEITFNGLTLSELDERQWRSIRGRQIGLIFQSPDSTFNPIAPIGRHLEEAIAAHRPASAGELRAFAKDALALVKMPRLDAVLGSYAFELSGGMCQRAALALALALRPTLVIADEPTSSLDLLAQAEITTLLSELRTTLRLSMIVISHDIGLIARLADRVAVMYAGRIVEIGLAEDVLSRPRHPYTKGLLASLPRLERRPRPLRAIPGHLSSAGVPAEGCSFAPRCTWAEPLCGTGSAPQSRALCQHWAVACWKAEATGEPHADRSQVEEPVP